MNTLTPVAPVITPVINSQDNDQVQKPAMYAVILCNDNSTFPDYVVDVLEQAFNINDSKAAKIMMAAHTNGRSVVHVVTKEVAETQITNARTIISMAVRGQNFDMRIPSCELTFVMEAE